MALRPKRFDAAFSMMQEANAIRHQFSRYDEAAELARMQQIMADCSAEVLAGHSDVEDASPVFVLGMPRSGTSLVEQILAAHPDVCACGENAMFSDAIAGGDPLAVSQWTNRQCQAAAQTYVQRLRQYDSGAPADVRPLSGRGETLSATFANAGRCIGMTVRKTQCLQAHCTGLKR